MPLGDARASSARTQNGATASLTFDALNRLAQGALPTTPHPVTTALSFGAVGFLSCVISTCNGATLDSHIYTRDAVGNITQEVIIGGGSPATNSFGYDDLYRLISATVLGTAYTWSYDAIGSRLSQTVGSTTANYTYDSAGHLTAVGGSTVSSGANGSVTADDQGGAYSWVVRGRLVGLTKSGTSYVFKYGPDNRRLYKSVNGMATTYLLDGSQVVTDTINGTANQTLYGPGSDHPLARNGEYFLPNHLNDATALTNSGGTVTQSYSYGPFGNLLNSPTDSNPFQFTRRENDGEGWAGWPRCMKRRWGSGLRQTRSSAIRRCAYRADPITARETRGAGAAAQEWGTATQRVPTRGRECAGAPRTLRDAPRAVSYFLAPRRPGCWAACRPTAGCRWAVRRHPAAWRRRAPECCRPARGRG